MFTTTKSQEHLLGMVDIVRFAKDDTGVFCNGIARQDDTLIDIDFLDDVGSFLVSQSGDEFRRGFTGADAAFCCRVRLDDFEAIAILGHEFLPSWGGASKNDGSGVWDEAFGWQKQIWLGLGDFCGHAKFD